MQYQIAIIITDITKTAGTERAVVNLSNILSLNLEHKVLIISVDTKQGEVAYTINKNVEILHLGLNISGSKYFNKICQYTLLLKELKKIKYEKKIDIFIGTYSLYNALISLIPNVKTIGCEHFNYGSASIFHKIIRRLYYPKLSATVVLTKHDSIHYKFLKRCFIIPNSLPFSPIVKESYKEKIVLSVGRYTKQKGFDLLLQAISQIIDKFPDWQFQIVGDGEDKQKLESIICENNLQNHVKLIPPQKDIISFYKNASIYCMSSRWEGIPLVLMESQACSLPAVSFDCPEGPSEVITNGINGFLCKAENPCDLAQKLALLMNDISLREKMGKKAYNFSFRFMQNNISKKWNEVIKEIYAN
ncbi:glycosyltransferase family 4 protein [Campylobacter sp. JMF_02 ED1]|uniref:glycosyltransferase family 4 protein n=1 Tax=unclassified Campylobacter TaxID=2593542 RepID=UPI0022E9E568|nr:MULTISPECIES: glycosyltransferase family 4 protein [unclassified Campylobacter]MDA3048775.1 glycosyltransferase family 4 protein [Campylobacter sp. JMF_15 NE4]MDA3050513.1 glycosyltransferase family 4 protein [Campylobacter sp. JMF_02 ED1]